MDKSSTQPIRFLKPAVRRMALCFCMPLFSVGACFLSVLMVIEGGRIRTHLFLIILAFVLVFSITYSLLCSWVWVKLFPVGCSTGGIHGHSVWGRKRLVRWDEIETVKPWAFLNLRWLRIYSSKHGETTWIALFQSEPADLLDALAQFGPPDNALLRHLNIVAKADPTKVS